MPCEEALKFTVNGALPDCASAVKEAEGGDGVTVGAGANCSNREGALIDSAVNEGVGGLGGSSAGALATQAMNSTERVNAIPNFIKDLLCILISLPLRLGKC